MANERPTAVGRRLAAGALIGAYGFAFAVGIGASVALLMGSDLSAPREGSPDAAAPYDWGYVIGESGLTFIALMLMGAAQAFLVADCRPSLLRLGATSSLASTTGRSRRRLVVVAAAVAVYSLSLVAAQILQQLMQSRGAGLPAPSSERTPTAAAMILAVHAGVAEEVIVVAGLVVAAGLYTQRALIAMPILIAARLAYHLYYGWAVIPLVLWAALAAYIIWRWRSWAILVGFIVLHVAWDALIHWPRWAHGDAILYLFGVPALGVLTGCFIVDRRWWSTPTTVSGQLESADLSEGAAYNVDAHR